MAPEIKQSLENISNSIIATVTAEIQSVLNAIESIKKSLDFVLADMLDQCERIHSETTSVVEANEVANLHPVSVSGGDIQMEVIILDPSLLIEDISYNNCTVKFNTLLTTMDPQFVEFLRGRAMERMNLHA